MTEFESNEIIGEIVTHIQRETERLIRKKGSEYEILYHGSKTGINGAIKPCSSSLSDFGKGFYLSKDEMNPLLMTSNRNSGRFYFISVPKHPDGVLYEFTLPDEEQNWLMCVAFHRGYLENYRETKIYEKYGSILNNVDFAIGPIANDRIFTVMDSFFQGNITDEAFHKTMAETTLGNQIVALSEKACLQIKVENSFFLTELQKRALRIFAENRKIHNMQKANKILLQNRRNGKYFDEIIGEVVQ